MTPYDHLPLNKRDRDIIKAISIYLLAAYERAREKNKVALENIELNAADSHVLADNLSALLCDDKFLESIKFSEAIIKPNALYNKRARNTFILRERFITGMGRQARISAWEEFYFDFGNMHFQEFLEIESKIFKAADIHPKVSYLILRLLDEHKKYVDDPRHMKATSGNGAIARSFSRIRKQLDVPLNLFGSGAIVSNFSLAAIATIVSNTSALWISKDFSIAGTISTLGAAALSLKK